MAELETYFATGPARDLFSLCTGERLGEGCSREVYVFDLNPSKVIKYETSGGSFENVMEWKAWERVKDDPSLARWLAPCHYISPNGSILIQERTFTPPPSFKWPDKIPDFMTDIKRGNFGLIGRRLVCHDYGLNLHTRTAISPVLRKARWWG